MKQLLKVENLSVKIGKKTILKGIDLEIKKGEIHALLGPNASGKTSLSFAIAGLPSYKTVRGKIFFENREITNLPPEKRTKLGIALCFQHPPVIRGLRLGTLLRKISKKQEKGILEKGLLDREINVDFSGGERKLSELAQVLALEPKFVIFDELDSGLDLENLEKLGGLIKEKLLKNSISLLLISHHGEIFHFLKPDFVHVMLKGKIINTSKDWKMVWQTIREYGYEKCKECPFFTR